MAPDFLAVKASSARDPAGSKLQRVLSAHLALERARLTRTVLLHILAVLGCPVWLVSIWPEWFSQVSRRLVLISWVLGAVAAAAASVAEWRWRSRRDTEAADIREDLPSGQ